MDAQLWDGSQYDCLTVHFGQNGCGKWNQWKQFDEALKLYSNGTLRTNSLNSSMDYMTIVYRSSCGNTLNETVQAGEKGFQIKLSLIKEGKFKIAS